MQRSLLSLATVTLTLGLQAQKLPQPSPPGKVEEMVGLTKVTVEYSRPSARDRKVFGDLVPYGEVWRTGANRCTTIEIDGDVKIEGQDLPAGKYSIFTIPHADHWVVILNRNTELWGEGDRKDEEDVLRVKVTPQEVPFTETFTIAFDAVRDDAAVMQLSWEKTRVGVRIASDATGQALANIREALAKPDADFRAYHSSARFCVDRGIEQANALAWAKKSVELDKRFWNLHTLALAQAMNGDHKSAIATAEESLKMAQEAKYEAYVKMNKEKIDEWARMVPPAKGKRK
jgi:hypothetical protein